MPQSRMTANQHANGDQSETRRFISALLPDAGRLTHSFEALCSALSLAIGYPYTWIALDDGVLNSIVASHGMSIHQPIDRTVFDPLINAETPPSIFRNWAPSSCPFVQGQPIVTFLGAPIHLESGLLVGSIVAIDIVERRPDPSIRTIIEKFAECVASRLVTWIDHELQIEALTHALQAEIQKLQDAHADLQIQSVELTVDNAKLKTEAQTDGLTGLRNHRTLFSEITRRFAQNEPFSLVLIDLDGFKAFNDVHGHIAGDEALRTVSHILASSIRADDVAARYGGEEFGLILSGASSDEALEISERIRHRIAQHPWPHRLVTICAGVAQRTPSARTIEELVQRADSALYAAKRSGKNRVLAWSEL